MTENVANEKSGLMDDLLEIFIAPAKVFARRTEGQYGLLLLVLVVLALVISLATKGLAAPYYDAEFDRQMRLAAASGGNAMPSEGMAVARAASGWFMVAGQSLALPFAVWIGALFVMLAAKIAGTSLGYRQSALIVTLASFPRLLTPIVVAIQGALVDPGSIRALSDSQLGPARYLDPTTTSPAIINALANFDLINLWTFALLAIGISVVGKVPRASGVLGAAVVLAIGIGLSLVGALFAG